MIKGKRGNIYMGVIFAFFFFIFSMLMLPLVKDGVTEARTDIGCSGTSLSDGEKLVCLGLDIGVPFFLVVFLTFVGGFIGNKL